MLIASNIDYKLAIQYQDPSTWRALWRVVDSDRDIGAFAVVQMLSARSSIFTRGQGELIKPLSEERLDWLRELALSSSDALGMTGWGGSWYGFYDSELRIAGREEEATKRYADRTAQLLQQRDPIAIASFLPFALRVATDEQLWSLIEVLRDHPRSGGRGRTEGLSIG